MAFRRAATAVVGACAMVACVASAPANADPIPGAAAGAGYRMETLAADSFSSKTIDLKLTYAPGFQWYYFNYWSVAPTPSLTTLNSDGSVTLADTAEAMAAYGTLLSSAGAIKAAPGYRGTAYGGGGYFEATFAFDATKVNISQGWPSFWSMALEHMVGRDQWAGQAPGYEHFIEPDFFEYDMATGVPDYGGEVHDWYGKYGGQCPPGYCNYNLPYPIQNRPVPSSTNFLQYHRYGFLWIPATAVKRGSFTYYFDGVQTGPVVYYTKFTNQAPTPSAKTPWTFGVIDQQHLVVFIGTNPPVSMHLKSVQVWQASAMGNVHN